MSKIKNIPCKKCTGTAVYVSSYTDKRNGRLYDQYRCEICGARRTRASKPIRTPHDTLHPEPPKEKMLDEKFTIKDEGDGTKSLFGFTGSLDELIKTANVDLNVWKIVSWEMDSGKWEVPMNLKSGKNNDRKSTPHKEVARKFKIRVKLAPRTDIIDKDKFRRELFNDLKRYSPVVHRMKYHNPAADHLLMVNLYDLHLDKVAWHEETGVNTDSKIAIAATKSAVADLLAKSQGFAISKILLPIGHDFFNSDYSHPTPVTTNGTPQQSDLRWQDAFRKGRQLCIDIIECLKDVAPVDVVSVPGNHDEERSFYLVDALAMYYHNDENVDVSESPKVRKYYQYGDNLIGLTHGKYEKPKELPLMMAREAKEEWAETDFQYWKLGHIHHTKKITMLSTEDMMGVEVEYLSSLTATDAWHFSRGFVGSQRKAKADVFAFKGQGQVAQLSSYVINSF